MVSFGGVDGDRHKLPKIWKISLDSNGFALQGKPKMTLYLQSNMSSYYMLNACCYPKQVLEIDLSKKLWLRPNVHSWGIIINLVNYISRYGSNVSCRCNMWVNILTRHGNWTMPSEAGHMKTYIRVNGKTFPIHYMVDYMHIWEFWQLKECERTHSPEPLLIAVIAIIIHCRLAIPYLGVPSKWVGTCTNQV